MNADACINTNEFRSQCAEQETETDMADNPAAAKNLWNILINTLMRNCTKNAMWWKESMRGSMILKAAYLL